MGIRVFYGFRAFVNSSRIRALNLSKSDGFVCRAFVNSSIIRFLNSSKEPGAFVLDAFTFAFAFVVDTFAVDAFGPLKNASDKIGLAIGTKVSKSNLK